MKKIIVLNCLLVILAILLSLQNIAIAKSENSKEGNSEQARSKQNTGSGKSSNSSEKKSSNENDNNKGSNNKEERADKNKMEQPKFEHKGKGKISETTIEKEKEASKTGKIKKLEKIAIKEATESAQGKRRAIQGLVTSIDGFTITLVHQIQRDRVYKVLYNSSTVIRGKEGSASASLKESTGSATLQVGQRIIAVGTLNNQGMLVAKRIFIIPGKASGIFKKNPIATASSSPVGSSSASPLP